MRTTAANVAARAAVGGDDMLSKWQLMAEQARQKREGLDAGPSSQTGKSSSTKAGPKFNKGSKEQLEAEKRGLSINPGHFVPLMIIFFIYMINISCNGYCFGRARI